MASDTIRIIIEVTGEAPLEVDLERGSYVLGREEACELFIENEGISRRHARVTVSEEGVTVEDLGSSNGSFLNGEAITEAVVLNSNSVLVLGADAIRIRLAGVTAAAEVAGTMPPSAAPEPEPAPTGELNLFDANYCFREEIARGGMGAVIEADDQNTGRTVAIKQMLKEGNPSEESKHRFLQEARVMGHLEHPNIVPMHELALDEEGMPYYTMKRIQGTDLQDVLTRIKNGDEETVAAYPLRTLLGIFLKVCDALAFAHSKGVIHRDLKPENIMLGEFGEVLVADWGLAKILPKTPLAFLHMAVEEGTEISEDEVSEEGSFKTMEGSVMGTPNYMAPEQAEGNTAEIDRLSDIFSLGGILYSILTLRPPVLGKTVSEVLENMRTGYIAPPVLYNKVKSAKLIGRGKRAEEEVVLHQCPNQQIPDSLSRVAMHAMNLERKDRYQKVQQFQEDIEAWQLGYATTAEEADFWRQIVLFVSRNKVAAIICFLVALVGTTMVGWSVLADQKARAAMAEMQTAVPLIEGELQATIDTGQFERAKGRLNSLIMLLPDKAEYRLQRARIHQSLLQFDNAAADFETAGSLEGAEEKYADDITFCRDMAERTSTNGLGDLKFDQFVNRLDREERFAEARYHRGKRIEQGRKRVDEIAPKALALTDERAALLGRAVKTEKPITALPEPYALWDFEFDGRDRKGNLSIAPGSGAEVADGALQLDGKFGGGTTEYYDEPLAAYSIEVWSDVSHGDFEDTTLVAIQQLKKSYFDALRFNLRNNGRWNFHRSGSGRTQRVLGPREPNSTKGVKQHVLTVGPEGIQIFINGTQEVFRSSGDVTRNNFSELPAGGWRFLVGHTGRPQFKQRLKGRIEELRLYRKALSPGEVEALYSANPLAYPGKDLLAGLSESQRERVTAIDRELGGFKRELKTLKRLTSAENSEVMLRSYKKLMADKGAPKLAVDRLTLRYDGLLQLKLNRSDIRELTWLKNIPLNILELQGVPITDLAPIRGMPLIELDIRETKVARLDPLAGMKLRIFRADQTPVTDISVLRGMPLFVARLNDTQVSDLSPLKGIPLHKLEITNTEVSDLSPLQGMELVQFSAGGCSGITNLAPLRGMPLKAITMWGATEITDVSPLAGMQLNSVGLNGFSKAKGWEALSGQPITSMHLSGSSVADYSFMRGMKLTHLSVAHCSGNDFTMFRDMNLRTILLENSSITDLNDLGGANHDTVDLRRTKVTDLSPLKGRTIGNLYLRDCRNIRDITPLLECDVQRLVVPPNATRLDLLRDHPTITHIAWDLNGAGAYNSRRWNDVPSKEEFWQAWDEGKRSR